MERVGTGLEGDQFHRVSWIRIGRFVPIRQGESPRVSLCAMSDDRPGCHETRRQARLMAPDGLLPPYPRQRKAPPRHGRFTSSEEERRARHPRTPFLGSLAGTSERLADKSVGV